MFACVRPSVRPPEFSTKDDETTTHMCVTHFLVCHITRTGEEKGGGGENTAMQGKRKKVETPSTPVSLLLGEGENIIIEGKGEGEEEGEEGDKSRRKRTWYTTR